MDEKEGSAAKVIGLGFALMVIALNFGYWVIPMFFFALIGWDVLTDGA